MKKTILHIGDLNGLSRNLCRISRESGINATLYLPSNKNPITRIKTLRDYDILQPCAMGTTYAWLAGKPTTPYAMGSDLRKVAFEKGLRGRLMRKGFEKAEAVFFSNPDHLNAVKSLGLNGVFIPQALNLTGIPSDKPYNPGFTIFIASRLEWTTPSSKGLNLFLTAFLGLPKEVKQGIRLVLVDWGADKEVVKRALRGYNATFLPFLDKAALYAEFAAADLVVDQFACGSFGLAALEAMLCATPVMVNINLKEYKECYGNAPSVIRASTAQEIADEISYYYELKDALRVKGRNARKWVLTNHEPKRITTTLKRVYAQV